jgi:hypothetical protein
MAGSPFVGRPSPPSPPKMPWDSPLATLPASGVAGTAGRPTLGFAKEGRPATGEERRGMGTAGGFKRTGSLLTAGTPPSTTAGAAGRGGKPDDGIPILGVEVTTGAAIGTGGRGSVLGRGTAATGTCWTPAGRPGVLGGANTGVGWMRLGAIAPPTDAVNRALPGSRMSNPASPVVGKYITYRQLWWRQS